MGIFCGGPDISFLFALGIERGEKLPILPKQCCSETSAEFICLRSEMFCCWCKICTQYIQERREGGMGCEREEMHTFVHATRSPILSNHCSPISGSNNGMRISCNRACFCFQIKGYDSMQLVRPSTFNQFYTCETIPANPAISIRSAYWFLLK